jgi:branched-chain amino acid transport system substrate-binding protein
MTGAGLVASVLAVAACGSSNDSNSGGGSSAQGAVSSTKSETVTIGHLAATSGPAAFAGVPEGRGFDLAIAQANASGELKGRKIAVKSEDDATDPAKALQIARKFAIDKDIQMIVGPDSGSFTAVASAPVYQKAGIPMVNTGGQASEIAKAGDFVFQTIRWVGPIEDNALQTAAQDCKAKTAAIVYAKDNATTVAEAGFAAKLLKRLGVKVLTTITISSTDSDFSSVVTKLQGAHPDLLYAPLLADQTRNLAKQAKSAGVKPVWVAATGSVSNALWEGGGGAVEGIILGSQYDPGLSAKENQDFRTAYKQKYGADPDNWGAIGYAGGVVAAAALKQLDGKPVTRTALKDALASFNESSAGVPVPLGKGTIKFGAEGEAIYDGVVLRVGAKVGELDTYQPGQCR